MNKIFKKLRFRTIKSNFKQFLSVIFIVLLATMLLSGFVTNSHMLNNTVNTYFKDTNLADLWVQTDNVSTADEEFYKSLNLKYDKRFYLETTATIKNVDLSGNVKVYVSEGKISTPYVSAVREGCFIDQRIFKDNNITTGIDEIAFDVKLGDKLTLPLVFRINGTMCFDECADVYSCFPVFISESVFLEKINYALNLKAEELSLDLPMLTQVPYNQVLLKTDDIEGVKTQIQNYYKTASSNLIYVLDQSQIESVLLLNSEVEQSKKMIYVFPIIFLIVSVLVILTTINQLVIQEKTKIGTLKSIGINDKKILRHYSSYGAVLCAIGSIIGTILGMLVIPAIMYVKYNLVYSIPADYVVYVFPYWWLLLIAASVTLLGYLVSFFACYNILHKKPIECLKYDINFNSRKLKSKKHKNKLPLPIKMAFRNIRLKPIRTIMATIGIAGCIALLLCGFGVGDTLNHSAYNDLGGVFKYDITTTYTTSDFEEQLNAQVANIEKTEKYSSYYAELITGKNIKGLSVYSIIEKSNMTSIKLKAGEACLSKAIANELDIKVGDKVILSLGGIQEEITITKFVETSFFNGVFVCRELAFNSAFKTNGMWINVSKNANNAVKLINTFNGTNDASTMQGMHDNVENKISSIGVMTTTLKTFAIMLAVVVLLNLIFLILKERTREIATLKVIGNNYYVISFAIFFEILFMALLGFVLGSLLGYPQLVLVLMINKVEIMNFLYYLSPLSYVFSGLIIIAVIVLVSLITILKVKKTNMIESLKSVE